VRASPRSSVYAHCEESYPPVPRRWVPTTFDGSRSGQSTRRDPRDARDLATAMQGNLRSHSLRAYSADEMDKILVRLPWHMNPLG